MCVSDINMLNMHCATTTIIVYTVLSILIYIDLDANEFPIFFMCAVPCHVSACVCVMCKVINIVRWKLVSINVKTQFLSDTAWMSVLVIATAIRYSKDLI